jgi:acetyl-CoA synthetase
LLLIDRLDASGFSSSFETVRTPSDAPAFISYTSGTTGPAKGVVQPQRVMLAGEELSYVQDLRENELYYGIGEWSWWVRKLLGPWQFGAAHLVYRYDRYDPEKLLTTLARHGVTNAFINATAIRLMMRDRNIGRKIPQRFRVVTSSNEPLGADASVWFREQFGTPPLEFYGSTEVGVMVGGSPYVPVKPGSMGTPIPGWNVRILDDEGREVPPGVSGEICLLARSNPGYPLGYWRRPEETERDFGGHWFHTKDIASMDADGHIWYVGRKDDIIKAAGYRIGPDEVEATLRRHPQVLEAGVIGAPDTERGTRVVAYVVLRPGIAGSEDLTTELQAIVRENYSKYAYPREVHFISALPQSSTGKTDRASLRKRHAEQAQGIADDRIRPAIAL